MANRPELRRNEREAAKAEKEFKPEQHGVIGYITEYELVVRRGELWNLLGWYHEKVYLRNRPLSKLWRFLRFWKKGPIEINPWAALRARAAEVQVQQFREQADA